MKFRLLNGGLSVDSDTQAIESLNKRMTLIAQVIDLFNESDWQLPEVAMWIQYEKDLALTESALYTKQQEQQ